VADARAVRRIPAAQLEAFIARALEAVRISTEESKSIAALMTRADLQGS